MPYNTNDPATINPNGVQPFDADEEVAALKEQISALEDRVTALETPAEDPADDQTEDPATDPTEETPANQQPE